MKIVMIGPVYPYKGGIAHYTGLMSKNLAKEHQVLNISYRLQYPKLLYKKDQKDFENDTFRMEDTKFLINTINPISWIKTAKAINKENPDVVIVQWWHPFFAFCYGGILSLLKKNIRVLFLCHNVLPHEKFPAQRLLTKAVLRKGDGFIIHSSGDMEDLKTLVPSPVFEKTVHPTYNAFQFLNMSQGEARKKLFLRPDEEVLLFFGFIREYKGLKHLIRAMNEIVLKRPQVKLLVVGDFFEGDKQEYLNLIQEVQCGDNMVLVDGYVPDKEVEKYFSACDIVVLPYESATQSGIVQIAYGFEKPVVATNVGGLPEVVIDNQTGFIVPPKDADALAKVVIRFFQEDKAKSFAENVRAEAYRYDWDRMNEVVDRLTNVDN